VKLYASFKERNKLYFLLDQMPNGTLHDFIHRQYIMEEGLTKFYIAELINSLEYLHSKQIAHRDLKPGNVLLDRDFHVVLCDFGTAKVNNPEIAKKIPRKALKNPNPKSYSSIPDNLMD